MNGGWRSASKIVSDADCRKLLCEGAQRANVSINYFGTTGVLELSECALQELERGRGGEHEGMR